VPGQALDPFFNEISTDKNDISFKRITDMVLIPLKVRTKRQIQLEQQEKLNKNINQIRKRRQTNQFRGKFRGQTQSQYLNFGNDEKKEGKAEAEATQQSSHAVVSKYLNTRYSIILHNCVIIKCFFFTKKNYIKTI